MNRKIFLVLTALLCFSCSGDDDGPSDNGGGNPNGGNPPVEDPNAVQLFNDNSFGMIMADADGNTLYFFSLDSKGLSNCNGECLDNWPVFYEENLTLDEGLDANDFGVITRDDGSMQTTYKGWPLYTYIGDANSGDVNGDGLQSIWFVAKPDYSVMYVRDQLVGRDADGVETNLTGNYEPGDGQTFYMTDARGNTLYRFVNDTKGVNNFTAEDFSNNGVWPIFEEDLSEIPSIFDTSDFGSIDVFGRQQLTYKGWPLYYFGQDEARGDNYGVGFPTAGIWPVVNTQTPEAPEAEAETAENSWDVTAEGATAYIFNGNGLNNAQNPDLTLVRGKTYEFKVNAPGHPLYIKTAQTTGTGDTYNDGVDDNGAASGNVSITVPADAPDVLYYICEFHSPMTGILTIVDE